MKDKLLFGTIGLLVGIVVMQWMMPSGHASITSGPIGGVVCLDQGSVLMNDGSIWVNNGSGPNGWAQTGTLPMSPSQVLYWDAPGGIVVDKNGDYWSGRSDGWHNYGKPPVQPLATQQSTWGKVKAAFGEKEGK
jgi:hypothetical protein